MNTSAEGVRSLRILLVDDHDLVRDGLRMMLESEPGWVICGTASTGHEAIELVQQLKPDIVVLDLHMPGMDGWQAAREILANRPETEILILSVEEGPAVTQQAKEVGAGGIVSKSVATLDLKAAVSALARHERFFGPENSPSQTLNSVRPLGTKSLSITLTDRERDVIRLVAKGQTNKQIALELGISVKTVESHRAHLMHKLGLKTTAELVRYAIRNQLIES